MIQCLCYQTRQSFCIAGKAARDEGSASGQRQRYWISRHLERTIGRGLGDKALVAGRRVLPLSQTVDLVVLNQVHDIQVAACGMDKVTHAQPHRIAVAVDRDHLQTMIGQLGPRRHSHWTTVQGHEPVGPDIVRQLAATANAANHEHLVRRQADLHQPLLHRRQDAIVTAAGAPRRFYRSRIVLDSSRHASPPPSDQPEHPRARTVARHTGRSPGRPRCRSRPGEVS